jgi:SNF2 family DNA or RNA helicase
MVHFPPDLAKVYIKTFASIVFSFWKTTLDMVAQMLDEHNMPYCRIHGQIPASKRSKVLSDFERTTSVRILLITLGTGAVG